jgi:hypothetical protein
MLKIPKQNFAVVSDQLFQPSMCGQVIEVLHMDGDNVVGASMAQIVGKTGALSSVDDIGK